MDSIAFRPELETTMQPVSHTAVPADVHDTLPVLEGRHVILRELRPSDASSLHGLFAMPEVARFIAPPPATVDAFERFIFRINRQRAAGRHVCFAVTLKDDDRAIGLFQIHETESGFRTAEWGFALGSPFWGTGIFEEGANLMLEFAFNTLGVHRLEARAVVTNGRGGRALQKLGAVQEGVLRKSFFRNGQYLDQVLYGIVQDDWRASRGAFGLAGQTLVLH
jgi:ribosomal-protein-alanine N-acetyltransferase